MQEYSVERKVLGGKRRACIWKIPFSPADVHVPGSI